jgi:hypothetical protein
MNKVAQLSSMMKAVISIAHLQRGGSAAAFSTCFFTWGKGDFTNVSLPKRQMPLV